MDRFEELHQRYVDNAISPEEYKEFVLLIQDQENAEPLEALMAEEFAQPRGDCNGMTAAEDLEVLRNILPKKQSVAPKLYWAAAAVSVRAVVAFLRSYTPAGQHPETTLAAADQIVTYSGKDFFTLPDGTKVTMNDGGKLQYSTSFGNGTREVTLKGEAFFDVAHDAASPFIVRAGKVSVRVLGTAFNVKSTSNEEIRVTVARGKVQVDDDQRKHTYGVITPHQEIAVNTATHKSVCTDMDSKNSLEWTSWFLILEDVRLSEAADIIGRRYHVKITFLNPALKNCGLNAKFMNDEKLPDILERIGKAMNIYYKIEGDSLMIGGKGC